MLLLLHAASGQLIDSVNKLSAAISKGGNAPHLGGGGAGREWGTGGGGSGNGGGCGNSGLVSTGGVGVGGGAAC